MLGLVVATPTSNEKRAGSPAVGAVVGGVIRSVGAPARVTVTVPEAWPAAGVVGVVVVPPPLAGGGVVLEPPCAPTLAVTVAVAFVVRTVCAAPALSVVTSVAVNAGARGEHHGGVDECVSVDVQHRGADCRRASECGDLRRAGVDGDPPDRRGSDKDFQATRGANVGAARYRRNRGRAGRAAGVEDDDGLTVDVGFGFGRLDRAERRRKGDVRAPLGRRLPAR